MDKTINAEAFEAFVSKAFKLTTEDLASLYNEAGELKDFSLLITKDAERTTKFQSDAKNQYSRGLKEAAQKLEKEIREKYDVDSDLIGVELLDHIIETKTAEVKGAGSEDVLKHPDVIKLINQHLKEKKTLDKEWQTKLENKEKEVNRNNLMSKIKSQALAEFRNLNAILPEDAKKAQALEDVLLQGLDKYNYQETEDGFSVLKEDGTSLLDEHGYPVTFQTHVKAHAERFFDFKKAEERSSPANKPTGQAVKVSMPKDEADYVNKMKDTSLTPQERVDLMKLWKTKK